MYFLSQKSGSIAIKSASDTIYKKKLKHTCTNQQVLLFMYKNYAQVTNEKLLHAKTSTNKANVTNSLFVVIVRVVQYDTAFRSEKVSMTDTIN